MPASLSEYPLARRLPREPDPQPRQRALRAARDEAAAVPLELSATAAELARLAGELALSGSGRMRSDSATAIDRQCTAAFADLTPERRSR